MVNYMVDCVVISVVLLHDMDSGSLSESFWELICGYTMNTQ